MAAFSFLQFCALGIFIAGNVSAFPFLNAFKRSLWSLDVTEGRRGVSAPALYQPDILPLSISVQRNSNNTATLSIQVQHSGSIYFSKPAMLLQPTDMKRIELSPRNDNTPSTVTINYPLDFCPQLTRTTSGPDQNHDPFVFSSSEPHVSDAFLSLNLCYFDIRRDYLDYLMSSRHDEMTEPPEKYTHRPVSQPINFVIPKINQEDLDKVFEEGQNVTIQVSVNIKTKDLCYITPLFYDSQEDKLLGKDFFIETNDGNTNIFTFQENTNDDIFSLRELPDSGNEDQISSGNQDPGSSSSQDQGETRLELSINTASGRYTGNIHVSSNMASEFSLELPIVRMSGLDIPISVRRPNQDEPLPIGKFAFRSVPPTLCTERGNRHFTSGNNCSLVCYVNGRGIQSVRIYPAAGQDVPGQSVYQVYNLNGIAFLDVGPKRDGIAGQYTCEVEATDGVTSTHTLEIITREPYRDFFK